MFKIISLTNASLNWAFFFFLLYSYRRLHISLHCMAKKKEVNFGQLSYSFPANCVLAPTKFSLGFDIWILWLSSMYYLVVSLRPSSVDMLFLHLVPIKTCDVLFNIFLIVKSFTPFHFLHPIPLIHCSPFHGNVFYIVWD